MIEPVSAPPSLTPQEVVPSIQMLQCGTWILESTLKGLALAGKKTLFSSTSPYYQMKNHSG